MGRINMTLENEVTNYLHHFIRENDNPQGKKRFPSEARDAIKKLTTFYMTKARLRALEEINSDNLEIAELKTYIEKEEKVLREFYRRDEIIGT